MNITDRARQFLQQADLFQIAPEHLEDHLGMTHRSLRRWLQQCGTTYRELVAEERKRRAAIALEQNPGMGFIELADVCGYQDHVSMQRVFKQWFGVTLTEWRRARQ